MNQLDLRTKQIGEIMISSVVGDLTKSMPPKEIMMSLKGSNLKHHVSIHSRTNNSFMV